MSNIDGRETSNFATWESVWSYTAKLETWSKFRVKKEKTFPLSQYVFGFECRVLGVCWNDWDTLVAGLVWGVHCPPGSLTSFSSSLLGAPPHGSVLSDRWWQQLAWWHTGLKITLGYTQLALLPVPGCRNFHRMWTCIEEGFVTLVHQCQGWPAQFYIMTYCTDLNDPVWQVWEWTQPSPTPSRGFQRNSVCLFRIWSV